MACVMFARWFGIVSVLLALGVLFNLDDAKEVAIDMIGSASGYILGGVLPIIFGCLSFVHHNSFAIGWNLVISIIGLLMVLTGLFRVMLAGTWKRIMLAGVDKFPALFSLFGLIFGLLLLYVGFMAKIVS